MRSIINQKFATFIFLVFCTNLVFAQNNNPTKLSLPENNFEIFWETFRDNYAFFDLKKVDWDAQYKVFRPKVTAKTNDKELVKIFTEMVESLNDGHITITKKK